MKRHSLYENYTLLTFNRWEIGQVLSSPLSMFGAYLSAEEWNELQKDHCLVTNNEHTIYLLQMANASLLVSDKIKFAEQYIRMQKMVGKYPDPEI